MKCHDCPLSQCDMIGDSVDKFVNWKFIFQQVNVNT